MDKVKPYTGKGATRQELRAYHRKYRRKHADEIRVRNRLWMRAKRRAERRETLKTKAS